MTKREKALEAALVECAGILESLAAAVKWEIAPEIMEEIRFKALPKARAALALPPSEEGAERDEAYGQGQERGWKDAIEAARLEARRSQQECFCTEGDNPCSGCLEAARIEGRIRALAPQHKEDGR